MFIFLLIFLLTPLAGQASAEQFVCKAPDSQANLCGNSYGFTPVGEPGLDLGISNPVNITTGEKFLKETDLPETMHGLPSFIRFYRSGNISQKGLGISWLNNYSIYALAKGNNTWQISFPDGQQFTAQNIQRRNGKLYWNPGNNRQFIFDQDGRLISVQTPDGNTTRLTYFTGHIYHGYLQSIQLNSETIWLDYQITDKTILLKSLETSLGKFEYHYQNGYLEKVVRPDGMWRQYHYEEPRQSGHKHLITGISLSDRQGKSWRARSWQYDNTAKVIKAWPGTQKDQALEFAYMPQQTRIKSAYANGNFSYKNLARQTRITQQSIQADKQVFSSQIEYDESGRLKEIGNLLIQRFPDGQIRKLQPGASWPGLALNYDQQGRLISWSSEITGPTRAFYHANGGLQGLQYANGDRLDINPDNNGRPETLNYYGQAGQLEKIQLGWHGQKLVKLQNRHETEYLGYDARQQLASRTVIRKRLSDKIYQEQFSYDNSGNLQEQSLAEGGQLVYQWQGNHITKISWLDKHGQAHTVINSVPGRAGYAYGNGLHTQVLYGKHQSWLILNKGKDLIWGEYRLNDPKGNLVYQLIADNKTAKYTRLAYDQHNRTIAINYSNQPDKTYWLAWHDDGRLLAQSEAAPPKIIRDTSGLPIKHDDLDLAYQAQRRLHKIGRNQKTLAEYEYNARGHRIYQEYANNSAHRFYADNRLAAMWHENNGTITKKQRFIYAQGLAVGMIEFDNNGDSHLYYVHNNQLGAPVLVTDGQQNIVWQADYDVFGKATITPGNTIDLPLRLPGQDADPVSGWHDNIFRTYLPGVGQYLEPDPLGPVPGQQAFGYAGQQPLRHTDPLGLVLLAFDGTRYNQYNHGNIWKLSQIYNDGPSFYHHGPGNSYYLDWDAVTASSSRQIQENQWQSLMNILEQAQAQSETVPIDIMGYSRGAALARDFANRIAANTNNGWFSYDDPIRGNIGVCVDLRFLGLFDTVAQFGILGAANAGYDLNISNAWQWVAHAVASHELRTLFPLVSIASDDNKNSVEVPFIGAHADIGGGMILDDDLKPVPNGDLSDVALNWMYWQAQAALVKQDNLANNDLQVTEPWLHDERSIIEKGLLAGDRNIQDSNTSTTGLQGDHPVLGNQQRSLFENFINRVNDHPGAKVSAIVDMQAYNLWLQQNLGMPAMPN